VDTIQLTPTYRTHAQISIDVDEWNHRLGDGGFAIAWVCKKEPHHVLKCIDEEVNAIDAMPKMRQITAHAKVMTERLTQIVNDPDTFPFARDTCKTLLSTITTHVGYSQKKQRTYLYQLKASGKSLESALADPAPSWDQRMKIALNFAKVMFALRRCRVVHLDCRPVNVFVDMSSPDCTISLIDMDGCGVLSNNDGRHSSDTWQSPPLTMGHSDELRPIWFPIDPGWQTPLAGNFKFAEKWCVINEVWKILSWGDVPALGWLEPKHDALSGAAKEVREMYASGVSYLSGNQHSQDQLNECSSAIARQFNEVFNDAVNHTKSIRWMDYGIGTGSLNEERFFAEFAMATLLAFRDPRDPRLPMVSQDYPKPEIPSAQWIQNNLARVMRLI